MVLTSPSLDPQDVGCLPFQVQRAEELLHLVRRHQHVLDVRVVPDTQASLRRKGCSPEGGSLVAPSISEGTGGILVQVHAQRLWQTRFNFSCNVVVYGEVDGNTQLTRACHFHIVQGSQASRVHIASSVPMSELGPSTKACKGGQGGEAAFTPTAIETAGKCVCFWTEV